MRKYSLDAYSEKKILFKEEKCSEIEQPQAKVLRLSVDNYAISQSDLDEEVDYTKEILQICISSFNSILS